MRESKSNKLRAADFFAGIGGLRLGFKDAGFEIVYSNDFDESACKTYSENFGSIECKDIKDIDLEKMPDFDVFLGGFPCQPYSMIGKRMGLKDERGKVFFQIIKVLNAKRPSAFVLENVKHLCLYNKGEVLNQMLKNLEWLGYKVYIKILDSKDFGVPQHRERLYLIGFLNENANFKLNKRNKISKVKSILEKHVDESYYLSQRYYEGLVEHKNRHSKRGNGFGCKILDSEGISNTLVSGNMGRERNLIQDKPVAKNKHGIRRLTIRECARLQGFPEWFKFPVSRTSAYVQLGNAVTVPVARAIANAVKRAMLSSSSSVPAGVSEYFPSSMEKAPLAERTESSTI